MMGDREKYVEELYKTLDRESIQSRVPSDPTLISGNIFSKKVYPQIVTAFDKAKFSSDINQRYNAVVVWGHSVNNKALYIAHRDSCPVLLCEDGFIRSIDTWCNRASPQRSQYSVSLTVDAYGYYFDSARPNKLVDMLNDNRIIVSEDEKRSAKRLIQNITENKISKYNHQPIKLPTEIGRKNFRKVLVVDQSYGDFSILRCGADDSTFAEMLNVAKEDNPDCDILVKTHPDAIAQGTRRSGYYQGIRQESNVFPIAFPCNPYSLMEYVDKVYVCSSQLGLESLMAGKEVSVFGKPFYSGWGLTKDYNDISTKRYRKLSLEELIYITYYKYIYWNNPDRHQKCSVEEACDWIKHNRPI